MGERWERNKFKEESRKVVIWTFESSSVCSVLRETFDRQKMDIRSLTQEHHANKRALEPKVVWDMALDPSLANNDRDIRPAILVLSSIFSSLPPICTPLSPGTLPHQPRRGHPVHAECIGCSSGRARY